MKTVLSTGFTTCFAVNLVVTQADFAAVPTIKIATFDEVSVFACPLAAKAVANSTAHKQIDRLSNVFIFYAGSGRKTRMPVRALLKLYRP